MFSAEKEGNGRERKTMTELEKARKMLEKLTPLKGDCGKYCGARCCSSLEGEETGMLLFPGEEDLYEDLEGWRILPAGEDLLIICPGTCDRKDRPLACRMFPLLPIRKGDETVARIDERSRTVCPLARQGKKGMDPAFAEAVRQAGEMLWEVPEQRDFLQRLAREQEELKALRSLLGKA